MRSDRVDPMSRAQRKLLDDASRDAKGFVVTEISAGHGPRGGKVRHGFATHEAAVALSGIGLLRFEHRTRSFVSAGRGLGVNHMVTVWSITPAGRDALANLPPAPTSSRRPGP